jgi:sugar lactone lactonase
MTCIILDETRCELGEGPTYDPAQDKAWWFDIVGRKLYEHDFAKGETSAHALPFMASMLGVIDANRQLIAAETGLYLRDTASGELTLHQPLEADNPVTRSNDGRVHPSGAIWIGTMGKRLEDGAGAFYWFFRGELKTLYPDASIPNATCFSPDGATAYFADTRKNKLMTVSVDPANGLPTSEPRVLYSYETQSGGGLDGAVVDEDGVIWVACWGASCVQVISPQGELLRSVPVPALQPSCPAFIGRNLDRLLVTTAMQNLSEEQRAQDQHGGKTLILDVPVRGRAEPYVRL